MRRKLTMTIALIAASVVGALAQPGGGPHPPVIVDTLVVLNGSSDDNGGPNPGGSGIDGLDWGGVFDTLNVDLLLGGFHPHLNIDSLLAQIPGDSLFLNFHPMHGDFIFIDGDSIVWDGPDGDYSDSIFIPQDSVLVGGLPDDIWDIDFPHDSLDTDHPHDSVFIDLPHDTLDIDFPHDSVDIHLPHDSIFVWPEDSIFIDLPPMDSLPNGFHDVFGADDTLDIDFPFDSLIVIPPGDVDPDTLFGVHPEVNDSLPHPFHHDMSFYQVVPDSVYEHFMHREHPHFHPEQPADSSGMAEYHANGLEGGTAVAGKLNRLALTNLFPNPVDDQVNLVIETDAATQLTLEVISMEGLVVRRTNIVVNDGVSRNELSCGDLAPGTYVLRLYGGQHMATGMVVKK